MKVKEIIARALRLTGRADAAETLETDSERSADVEEAIKTMLFCFNAVENELARNYFPLVFSEEVGTVEGKINYADLSYNPVKITSVKSGGKPVGYRLKPQYIVLQRQYTAADADVSVEYNYIPSQKNIEDDSAFDGTEVGELLVAYGTVSEYCLINGESAAAALWESKYRDAIDRSRRTHRRKRYIPPRRWV